MAIPRTDKPFANRAENFQFVIVGDRTGGHRPGVFRHAIQRINQLQPEFVVGVGDLIEGYKDSAETLTKEWEEFDAVVDQLDMPFYYTVGNHDIGDPLSADIWRQRYGRDYYSFIYKNVLFVSLNTEDPPIALSPEVLAKQAQLEQLMQEDPERIMAILRERRKSAGARRMPPKLPGAVAISDAQLDWLENVLHQNQEVRWTILLMHKPAWEYSSDAFERIEVLLKDRPYTVVAGHEHFYNYSQRAQRDYVTMSTTGGIWLTEGGGSFDHIAWVTMTDNGPLISNISLCGLLGTPQQTAESMANDFAGDSCVQTAPAN